MRFPALAIFLAATAAIVLLASDVPDSSLATSPPSAQRFSVDMDPYFTTSNTATSLGTLESCASIEEDNVLNLDEDFVDTVEFDVTVTGIPAANAMSAYTYTLSYPAPDIRVTYQQPMLIGPPITLSNSSDPLPDNDGSFNVSVMDLSGPAESGSGVLDRIRFETVPPVTPGAYPVNLSNAAHIDTNSNSWAPDALDNAMIEVNSGGCALLVDIEMVSMSLTSANPLPIGTYSNVDVNTTIRNNSPYAVNTDAVSTFNVPSDCTVNGGGGSVVLNAPLGVLAGGASTGMLQTASLRCTALGPHSMPVTACGIEDDVFALDLNNANNCQTQNLNFDVVAPPGTDSDGDGVWDLDEFNCGVSTFGVSRRPERMNGYDDDGDTQTDEALPVGAEAYDCDGDGYTGTVEAYVFQAADRDQRECGTANWAADFVSGGIPDSTNRVTVNDLTSFLAPTRHLNTNVGDNPGNVRWDTMPGKGAFGTDINIADLTSLIVTAPAMFGGTRAYNGLACGAVGCSNATWCTNTSNPAGVALRLETDRLVYHIGESVQISLTVTNTGADYVIFNSPWGSCTAVFMVDSWSSNCSGLPVCMIPEGCASPLPPGSSFTIPISWNQVDGSGVAVPRGDYPVFATLDEDSCSFFDCTVPTTPGSSHHIRLLP